MSYIRRVGRRGREGKMNNRYYILFMLFVYISFVILIMPPLTKNDYYPHFTGERLQKLINPQALIASKQHSAWRLFSNCTLLPTPSINQESPKLWRKQKHFALQLGQQFEIWTKPLGPIMDQHNKALNKGCIRYG